MCNRMLQHTALRAPRERAEQATDTARYLMLGAHCKHRACVALYDEIHMVQKSLKLLRQSGAVPRSNVRLHLAQSTG
jgi:hypothetical protein